MHILDKSANSWQYCNVSYNFHIFSVWRPSAILNFTESIFWHLSTVKYLQLKSLYFAAVTVWLLCVQQNDDDDNYDDDKKRNQALRKRQYSAVAAFQAAYNLIDSTYIKQLMCPELNYVCGRNSNTVINDPLTVSDTYPDQWRLYRCQHRGIENDSILPQRVPNVHR